jgi:hypothetical protein
MKRELEALLLILCPTERSTDSFIKLALKDDWEHDPNPPRRGKRERKKRIQQLRNSVEERQNKISLFLFAIILIVLIAIGSGVKITSHWIAQFTTAVLIVLLLRPLEQKTEEKMFDGNDLVERSLDLGKSILFWLGILITVISLWIPE